MNEKKFTVVVEGENWTKALDKAFAINNKKVTIKGYRKGKAPRDIYEKQYGVMSLFEDAYMQIVNYKYIELIEKNKLNPIIEPNVEIKDINKEKCEMEYTVFEKPEINLKKYTGLNVKKEEVKVLEEEIVNEMTTVRKKFAEIVEKDGAIENGDVAIIDFKGLKDGEVFEGGTAENYKLEIGSNSFIQGFEEGLVGMKVGDFKALDLKFPENYMSEDLAGKDVVFEVTVRGIETKNIAELNKDFFEDLNYNGVDSEETLKEFIKNEIESKKINEVENKYFDTLFNRLIEENDFEVADKIIKTEQERLLTSIESNIKSQGIDPKVYYSMMGQKKEDILESLKTDATRNIKVRFLLDTIAEKENIKATEKEITKRIEELTNLYKISEKELIEAFGSKEIIEKDVIAKNTVDFLTENNK
ncbi:MAG: trigger factor [Bacilli bacterium]